MSTPAPRAHFRILVVDDLAAIHDDFRKILRPTAPSADFRAAAAALFADPVAHPTGTADTIADFTVDCAFQGEQALELVHAAINEEKPYALAFVDVRMPPGWDGLETIRRIWGVDPELQVVLCTAYSDYSWTETVRTLGLTSNLIILKKPFDNTEVLQLAHALTHKWRLAREQAVHLADLDDLVRRRTEELRRAEDTFAQAFAANPHAQAIIALDHIQLIAVNQAFERTFDLPQSAVVGTNPENFGRGVDPDRLLSLIAKLKAGQSVQGHTFTYQPAAGIRRDMSCSARPVEISGRPCSIWAVEDITDRLHLENQLRQAQKMEAIGQLAAGVAHDFNNLLTVIQCYTSELLADAKHPELRPTLEPVHAAAIRAATLTRQLLVFSRKQITQFEDLDLATLLANLRPFLGRLIGEHVNLRWDFPKRLPLIHGDAAGLEQIVVNLVVNARDAVPAGGNVTLRVTQRTFTTAAEANHAEALPGHYLALEVADNGSGIPADILPRIFEPFFTTKDVGKGTGLGLSTVYSLARQHQGWIDVRTALGQGTTFTVFLPVLAATRETAADSAPHRRTPADLPPLRILAVEDDITIQSMLRVIFQRYKVPCTVVADGNLALAEWRRNGPYDLLISDIVMPNGISGIDLARQLRTNHPLLPIIFITGYSPEHVAGEKIEIPGQPPRIALKPFSIESLTDAIFEVLKPLRPAS